MRAFLGFFLVSGFCGLVYQVVWLRLSMSAFGVTAPMISIVVSVFMAGLALGSLAAGRLEKRLLAGGVDQDDTFIDELRYVGAAAQEMDSAGERGLGGNRPEV